MTEDIAKYKEMLEQIWREFKPDVRYGIHDRIVRGEIGLMISMALLSFSRLCCPVSVRWIIIPLKDWNGR